MEKLHQHRKVSDENTSTAISYDCMDPGNIEVKHGLGGVNQKGLSKDGDAYVNDSFGKSSYTLYLSIDEGTGTVKLEA